MGRTIGRLGAIVGLGFLFVACSGTSKTKTKDPIVDVCVAGAKSCDGLDVKVCSADGSELTTERTCLPSQTCTDGICSDAVGPGVCNATMCTGTSCLANTKFCQDGSVWKCDGTGSSSKLSQTCTKSQFCREADDSASCSDTACTPGEKLCDGNVATTCEADGSGPQKMGGTDCAATKQACDMGACHDTNCVAGMKLCKDGDVYICAPNGADTSLLVNCPSGTACDGGKLACLPKVCVPGSLDCDGTRPVTCNEFGTHQDPAATDCATINQVCVAGACKKTTCTPNSVSCQDGNVTKCDSLGLTTSISQTCSPLYYHCVAYPGSNAAYCVSNQCFPDQVLCNNNSVVTCAADGTIPATGTDCGDKYCENGTCQTRLCDPNAIVCKNGDVYSCDWTGTQQYLAQKCPTDTACQVNNDPGNGNTYACVPFPCSPGDTACLGNKIGTCAADGQSIGTLKDDCTLSSSVCGPDNKCALSALDLLGNTPEDTLSEATQVFFGDVVQVSSARTLTQMQLNLVLATARKLNWVVFEQTDYATFTARKNWLVTGQSGTGFFSSGTISYPLKVGKTYLFGVVADGSGVSYAEQAPFDLTTSFGTVLGRVESSYSSSMYAYPDPGYAYQMKLTTTP